MEKCIKCGEITEVDTRDNQQTTYTTCPKCEYKPERANVPTKTTLKLLGLAYLEIKDSNVTWAKLTLIEARDKAIDQRVVDDLKSVYDLLDKPQEAIARIADILTCGGKIYDKNSEFLKPKE